jgi:hypothetical protein
MLRVTQHATPRIRTREQAEAICYRSMAIGFTTMGIGLFLCLTVVLVWLGVPMLVLGALIVLAGIGWGCPLMKRPTEEIWCRHCHKHNVVFQGVSQFRCGECGHQIERQDYQAVASGH